MRRAAKRAKVALAFVLVAAPVACMSSPSGTCPMPGLDVAAPMDASATPMDASAAPMDASAAPMDASATNDAAGRMLVLPGVYNTRFQLRGFVNRAQERLPGFDIEVRRWGTPLLALRNLRAYERNAETAARMAEEIAARRRERPDERFYLVGYSGGGGMAALVVAALPEDVMIDRLILIAPAISPGFPLERDVLPRVRELVVNYASERDIQVGWGTRTFGTIDRKHVDSAGAVGFDIEHPKLAEWHWQPADRGCGHRGNHIAYLGKRWQLAELMPALEPAATADALEARWTARHEEL